MRARFITIMATAFALNAHTQTSTIPLQTDDDKAFYTMGVLLSDKVGEFDATDAELAIVKAGLEDGARNRPRIDIAAMRAVMPRLQALQQSRTAEAALREGRAGAAYMAQAAAENGARKLANGMIYKPIVEGVGPNAEPTDVVRVTVWGKYVDGTVIPSFGRPDVIETQLNKTSACFVEGVQQMKPGGKALFVCAPELNYAEDGPRKELRANATLVIEVELLGLTKEAR